MTALFSTPLLLRVDDPLQRILPHEQTMAPRVERVLASWKEYGYQSTPVAVFAANGDAAGAMIVADGHHRLAAAETIVRVGGEPVEIAARVLPYEEQPPLILPAHKVIASAPVGWVEACVEALGKCLQRVSSPVAGNGVTLDWRNGAAHFDGGSYKVAAVLHHVWRAARLDDPEVVWEIEGDASRAVAALERGSVATLLVPAVRLADVIHAARSGELLPPRSTNFQPKLVEGSVRVAIRWGRSMRRAAASRGA